MSAALLTGTPLAGRVAVVSGASSGMGAVTAERLAELGATVVVLARPGRTPDKAGALELYTVLRAVSPDFHAVIHWRAADGGLVTTYSLMQQLGAPPGGR